MGYRTPLTQTPESMKSGIVPPVRADIGRSQGIVVMVRRAPVEVDVNGGHLQPPRTEPNQRH